MAVWKGTTGLCILGGVTTHTAPKGLSLVKPSRCRHRCEGLRHVEEPRKYSRIKASRLRYVSLDTLLTLSGLSFALLQNGETSTAVYFKRNCVRVM